VVAQTTVSDAQLTLVAGGFNFPSTLSFDDEGNFYVAETGLPFGGAERGGKVWKVSPDGERTLLLSKLSVPTNGATYHEGALYVTEGGHPAKIGRYDLATGEYTILIKDLPGPGNYHADMIAFGSDGKMYFAQGAMTNTGVMGLDAYELGWLRKLPHAVDIPGYDIVLSGVNVETRNPLVDDPNARARTGAFAPFGDPTEPGRRIEAQVPATASIMRANPDGTGLELVCWGVRNAYALGFAPDGRLLAIDQGADDRGSRPVGDVPDLIFEIKEGAWYGWPDFAGDVPFTSERFKPVRGEQTPFVLANHDELPKPEKALLEITSHAAACKFDFMPNGTGGYDMLIGYFGDELPMCGPAGEKVGRSVVKVDMETWTAEDFVISSRMHRPIDVKYDASDNSLWILDFGDFEMTEQGVIGNKETGGVYKLPLG
jgi:glucose/arabinose dehydrogenase